MSCQMNYKKLNSIIKLNHQFTLKLTNSIGNTFRVYTLIVPLNVLLIMLLVNFLVPLRAPCKAFRNQDRNSTASPEGEKKHNAMS